MRTIDKVKADLPAVAVKVNGRLVVGTIKGRMNDFATITFELGGCDISFEASWECVTRAVNNKGFVRYN